jgi:hypothetical protein
MSIEAEKREAEEKQRARTKLNRQREQKGATKSGKAVVRQAPSLARHMGN